MLQHSRFGVNMKSIRKLFPQRTIAYVDGYNLYRGMVDPDVEIPGHDSDIPLRKYLWLNLDKYIRMMIEYKGFSLVRLKYFTAFVLEDQERKERQDTYIRALETLPNFSKHFGRFIPSGGSYREKQTDVKIALHMFADALSGKYGSMLLLSGDTDQAPTLKYLRKVAPKIIFHVLFPPLRTPRELKQESHYSYKIRHASLQICQFENPIIRPKLDPIYRPDEWK